MWRAGGGRQVEVPRGGRPGWWACSAGGVGGEAGVGAGDEHSGLWPELRADPQQGPGNPWRPEAGAVHFEQPAAGPGADAGRPPGPQGLHEDLEVEKDNSVSSNLIYCT